MGILELIAQAAAAAAAGSKQNHPQFDQVTQHAPDDLLAKGLSAAFGSNQTPPIGNMVSQLFGQSNGAQQAGMLNQLIRTLGPTLVTGLAGGMLAKAMRPGQTEVSEEQAAKLTPQQVQEVVNEANDAHPGIADQMGDFYAQHKGLINTLGGLAATVALMKMKDHMSDR
jgi:hypothetical protein